MISSKVLEIFQDILDLENEIINLKTGPEDIQEWDSVATVKIIVALEAEFKIKFKLEDIQDAKTVKDFISLVEKYKDELSF